MRCQMKIIVLKVAARRIHLLPLWSMSSSQLEVQLDVQNGRLFLWATSSRRPAKGEPLVGGREYCGALIVALKHAF